MFRMRYVIRHTKSADSAQVGIVGSTGQCQLLRLAFRTKSCTTLLCLSTCTPWDRGHTWSMCLSACATVCRGVGTCWNLQNNTLCLESPAGPVDRLVWLQWGRDCLQRHRRLSSHHLRECHARVKFFNDPINDCIEQVRWHGSPCLTP